MGTSIQKLNSLDSQGWSPDRWEEERGDYEGYSKKWRTLELIVSCKADELLFTTDHREDQTLAYHLRPLLLEFPEIKILAAS